MPGRWRSRAAVLLVGALVLAAPATEAKSPTSKWIVSPKQIQAAVNSAYDGFAAGHFVPGMAIAVVSPTKQGKLQTHLYTFGYASLASAARVTDHTQFEIGSETKLFTAALLADAVQQNIVQETEPIQNALPNSVTAPTGTGSCAGSPITFADLATHNSGLPRSAPNFPFPGSAAARAAYSPTQLYDALENAKLVFCPGEGWLYSNFAFGVLGQILSYQEASTYGKLIHSQITGPLRMPETTLEIATPHLATGYRRPCTAGTPGCSPPLAPPHCPCFARDHATGVQAHAANSLHGIPSAPFDDNGAYAGAGGLVSSISDMAGFVRGQLGVGPSAVVQILQMTQQRVTGTHGGTNGMEMGLAWQDYVRDGVNYLTKDGSTLSMTSGTVLLPVPRVGVTVLSNGPSDDIPVAQSIIEKLFGISPP